MVKVSKWVEGVTLEEASSNLFLWWTEGVLIGRIIKVLAQHKEILFWKLYVQQGIWLLDKVRAFLSLNFLSENSDGDSVLLNRRLFILLGKNSSVCRTPFCWRTLTSLPFEKLRVGSTSCPPPPCHCDNRTSSPRCKHPKWMEGCSTALGWQPSWDEMLLELQRQIYWMNWT